jgi:DNA-binding MarR family transcriptional regulator
MPDLREDIRQRKPFTTLEQEAQLSVVRTASLLVDGFEQMLKPYGITATQYNVLRILRGAEPEGLCRNELRDRMLTRMPDVTRLLDRMEDAKLVSRSRSSEDRRLVSTRITPKGLRLLDELEDAVAEEHMRRFHHLSKTELKALIELLKGVRERLSLHGPQA